MAGIAGIDRAGQNEKVALMLEKISHRGDAGKKLLAGENATIGAIWPAAQVRTTSPTLGKQAAWDGSIPPIPDPLGMSPGWEPVALAADTETGLFLARDPLGIRPLYYGRCDGDVLCFASEMKALLPLTREVKEFPPGEYYSGKGGFKSFHPNRNPAVLEIPAAEIASGLRLRLEQAVSRQINDLVTGCWLSGGLDSSAIAALARPHVRVLHTFASGVSGAPDLGFARQVAGHLQTVHHEITVTLEDMLSALPEVIYHLESFDALLVRSSVTNYLAAREAASYVQSVFSGEGADELFAGYAYLKQLPPGEIPAELAEITHNLHNTALQRVDRSASAHGLVAHVPFLDPEVVTYAERIPAELKLTGGDRRVEKWVVRQALSGLLPEQVLWRRKAKFWEGAGVGQLLEQHANEAITGEDFRRGRALPNGWKLNTKEEFLYYQIFREHFGEIEDLSWMGRTKGAPRE
jgi:asparagine synthase (glutamine-hydrolysing)